MIAGPLTEGQQRIAEDAYALALDDPYYDRDDATDRYRCAGRLIDQYCQSAGELLLYSPDEATNEAWIAEGIYRARRWMELGL